MQFMQLVGATSEDTERNIERWAERQYDALDRKFMRHEFGQEEYDRRSRAIAEACDTFYAYADA